MARFLYERDGEVIEDFFPCGKAPETIRRNGKRYRRDLARQVAQLSKASRTTTHHRCVTSGVDVTQARSATEDAKARGYTAVEFCSKTGDALYDDKAQWKDYCEDENMYHRNAGYGDPTPQPVEAVEPEYGV